MKNVMVIDGADNCTYPVFAATDEQFALFFPRDGQDVAFIDEIMASAPKAALKRALSDLWTRPMEKSAIVGLHGTIFYQLESKKKYYPTRRESEFDQLAGIRKGDHHG